MLQTIGLMMAAYIFTRMVDTATRETSGSVTKVFAVLTLLFTLLCVVLLLAQGASMPSRF